MTQSRREMMNSTNDNHNSASGVLQVKMLTENATMPTRGSPQSAGFDLSSAKSVTIPAGGRGIVPTDISIACPPNTYGRIAPRSGLAVKKFIDVGAGVVDADYRGPVGVVLFNFGDEDFEVSKGDRVAQLILEEIRMVDAIQVEELNETLRGEGGFGSTGVKADIMNIDREDDNPERGLSLRPCLEKANENKHLDLEVQFDAIHLP